MAQGVTEIELRLLMDALYSRYGYDFRNYAGASQRRRVLHAMQQLGCPTISMLQSRVLRQSQALRQSRLSGQQLRVPLPFRPLRQPRLLQPSSPALERRGWPGPHRR